MAEKVPPLEKSVAEVLAEEKPHKVDLEKIHLTPAPADDEAAEQPQETHGPAMPEDELNRDIDLPRVSFDDARRLMTRTDFFEGLDHDNVSWRRGTGTVSRQRCTEHHADCRSSRLT